MSTINWNIGQCWESPVFYIKLKQKKKRIEYLPTAGDIDLEPVDPVGDGVGLIPCELGVPGAAPPELSLLLPPLKSWNIENRNSVMKIRS